MASFATDFAYTDWQPEDGGPTSQERAWSAPFIGDVSSELFARFQLLIYELSGVWLGSGNSELLAKRLAPRVRATAAVTLKRYYDLVTRSEQASERERMVDAVTAGTPRFFRVPRQFEFLAQRLFPRIAADAAAHRRAKRVRVWSAGCGSGEEPYSLAMLMLRNFSAELGWECELVATDVSPRALDATRQSTWPVQRAREVPQDFLEEFMLKGSGQRAGEMRASEALRQIVRCGRFDLMTRRYPSLGLFDVIFCRGVLVFFDLETRTRIVGELVSRLAPAGFLIVDEDESICGLHSKVRALAPSIYGESGPDGRLTHDFRAPRRPTAFKLR